MRSPSFRTKISVIGNVFCRGGNNRRSRFPVADMGIRGTITNADGVTRAFWWQRSRSKVSNGVSQHSTPSSGIRTSRKSSSCRHDSLSTTYACSSVVVTVDIVGQSETATTMAPVTTQYSVLSSTNAASISPSSTRIPLILIVPSSPSIRPTTNK